MIVERQGLLDPGGLVGGILPSDGLGGILPSVSIGLPPLLGGGGSASTTPSSTVPTPNTSVSLNPPAPTQSPSSGTTAANLPTTVPTLNPPLITAPPQAAVTTPIPLQASVILTSYSTSVGGGVVTLITTVPGTSLVTATSTASLSASSAKGPTPFFQNKPLVAGVFSAGGFVLLIILAALFTTGLRRRVRARQDKEARTAAMIHEGFREHRFDDGDDHSSGHESHTGGQPMQASYNSYNTPMRQPIVAGYSVKNTTDLSRIAPFDARPIPSNPIPNRSANSSTIGDDADYNRLRGLKVANM